MTRMSRELRCSAIDVHRIAGQQGTDGQRWGDHVGLAPHRPAADPRVAPHGPLDQDGPQHQARPPVRQHEGPVRKC